MFNSSLEEMFLLFVPSASLPPNLLATTNLPFLLSSVLQRTVRYMYIFSICNKFVTELMNTVELCLDQTGKSQGDLTGVRQQRAHDPRLLNRHVPLAPSSNHGVNHHRSVLNLPQ